MSATLRRWCDRLLEGGWLLAVVLVTLYFNIYTKDSRIFEPQKSLWLRTLVTIMLAIWAIRTLEENRERLQEQKWWRPVVGGILGISAVLAVALFVVGLVTWQDPLTGMVGAEPVPAGQRIFVGVVGIGGSFITLCGVGLALVGAGYALRRSWLDALRTVMVIPALAYVAVHVVATIGSVFPRTSLYGGYVRQQGTLTVLAYIGLFLILAFNLRQREQLERLITVILLSSIPAALYGMVQKFGIDPLPWMGQVERRVASTMGNAIFIAAYLIMILPFTWYRLLSTAERVRESPPPEETPTGRNGILRPLYPGLLWSGIGLILAIVFLFAPIAISIQITQLRQQNPALLPGEELWPEYGHNLLLFLAVAVLTLAVPAVLYIIPTLIWKRQRPYFHLLGLGTALAGAAALLFVEATRTNGFAWGGYLASLCGLALLSRWQHARQPWGSDALWADAIFILLVVQSLFLFVAIKAYLPTSPYPSKWWLYLAALIAFFFSCYLVISARIRGRVGHLAQLGGYAVLAGLQLVCIVLTQSRGPLTGLLASLFAFALVWMLRRRIRWAVITVIVGAVVGLVFLSIFNLPNTPILGEVVMKNPQMASIVDNQIASLQEVPYLGRLGKIFDASEGTGKVRVLIWFGDEIGTGSVGMIIAHPLRTLIGYGPDAMHVAYNPYYPPELAHVEKRNASPDRAHNAIFDELITLGGMGLAAYLFYFLAFFILVWKLLWKAPDIPNQALGVGLFSLGVAHFFETFFGIPIVSTRMYMWIAIGIATALTFLPPFLKPREEPSVGAEERETVVRRRSSRRRRRASRTRGGIPNAWALAYVIVGVGALVFAGRVHLKPIWADILFWRAKQMEAQAQAYQEQAGQLSDENLVEQFNDKAIESAQDGLNSLHRAISLLPGEDFYYLSLAQLYLKAGQQSAQLAQQAQDRQQKEAFLREREAFFDSTERAILQARDISPLNTDHYRNLSALYLAWFLTTQEADNLALAIAYGEQAISMTPNNADLHNRLGRVYMTAAASTAVIQEEGKQQALDWLQNWEKYHLTSTSRDWDTHLPLVASYRQEAQELLEEGKLRRGLLVLTAAELRYSLFLDDEYDDTYLLIGDLYRELGMAAEAALMYGEGIRLKPNLLSDAQAETRIRFLASGGALEPLIQGYEAAAARAEDILEQPKGRSAAAQRRLHNQASQSYQALGFIYIVQEDTDTAIAYYELALSHRNTLEARKNAAILYQQTGELDLAISHAEAALELAQKQERQQDIQALQNFIDQVRQLESQIEQAEAYVTANPEDYQAHYDLAGLYKQIGRMEDAIYQAELATYHVPTDQPDEVRKVYTRLGNFAFLNNQYDLAETAFEQVLQVDEQNFAAHYRLAFIYHDQGRTAEALIHAEAALEVAPENRQAELQALVEELRQAQGESP